MPYITDTAIELPTLAETKHLHCVLDHIQSLEKKHLDAKLSIDPAMPQVAVTALIDVGFDPRGKCGMFYSSRFTFGQIRGFTQEWDSELQVAWAKLT